MKKIFTLCLLIMASTSILLAQSPFDFTPTPGSAGIIATVEVDGAPASDADWIGAFDEEQNCAGAVQLLDYYSMAFCNLQVYGDDILTTEDEGLEVGQPFTFKLWVAATGNILEHPEDLEPPIWDNTTGVPLEGYGFADGAVIEFRGISPDDDGDGYTGEDDPDDTDPCNPDNNVMVCDTDGDGIPDGSDPYPNCSGTPDDGCDLTVDSFDDACVAVNTADCPAGTSFNASNCVCDDIVIDGCTDPCDPAFTTDSTNDVLCEGYDTVCDDMDCSTIDSYDSDNCVCVNTPDPALPLDCDDMDCSTIDAYDEATCTCSNTPDPALPLDCDDIDCSTIDAYDEATCSCTNTPDPALPLDCDDGDCANGEETYNAATCSCDPGTPPTCADGERFNATTCMCELIPDTCDDPCAPNFGEEADCQEYNTDCDDMDCSTIDAYDTTACACTNTPDPNLPLDCSDGDCTNGEETYNTATCSCDPGTPPTCADGERFNAETCMCELIPDTCDDPCAPNFGEEAACQEYNTDCDDMDCSTIDAYDTATCACTNTPDPNLPLDCDDGDCTNGEETYNAATCSCDPGTPPTCPDGESFNSTTCMCEAGPVEGCTNMNACNYNPMATVDDDSCIVVEAATINGGPFTFCVGDGTSDFVDGITVDGGSGSNSAWVITDDQLNILGLPPMPGVVDFDPVVAGTCLIWYVVYEDDLTGAEVGQNAADLGGCFALSNSIEVIRELAGCTDPNADNYNPDAECDDGNCQTGIDCILPSAGDFDCE